MEDSKKKEEKSERSEETQREYSRLEDEINAGEWQNLKKFKEYQDRSRQGKIIATYQAISNRLNQLVALYYKFMSTNPKQGAKLLKELRKLRFFQEILLNCLVWEPQGQLEEKNVPPEIWELIQ